MSFVPSIRMVSVDLSTGQVSRRLIEDREILGKFLGGRGYATWSLLKTVDPHLDADNPESPIVFAPGVLTGTSAPSSGRTSVIFKSPVTRRFFKTNVGGHFGAQLKFAGIDPGGERSDHASIFKIKKAPAGGGENHDGHTGMAKEEQFHGAAEPA